MSLALADAAIGLKIKNSSYRNLAKISDNLASRDLKALVDEGLIKAVGENRGRAYMASDKLLATRNGLYEPFKLDNPFDSRARAIQPMLPGIA